MPAKNTGEASAVTSRSIAKLQVKLSELFQLDRGDLDFGLYRIMAVRREDIKGFLEHKLLPQVADALGSIAQADAARLEKELDNQNERAKELGFNPDDSPKVQGIRAQLKAAKTDQQAEADVYNHLYTFFARYYNDGDFMSLRRYKGEGKEAYLIPYNGEEVKLHWANADQYYIKSTENYASYAFVAGKGKNVLRVCFEITAADNEKDDIKEENKETRCFMLASSGAIKENTMGTLVIKFEHRPLSDAEKKGLPSSRQQDELNTQTETQALAKAKKIRKRWFQLLSALAPTDKHPDRTLLGKHIATYTAKNSFDYFIHKDLRGFLSRELDMYLKNEVLFLDDLEGGDSSDKLTRCLAQMKAIRQVAHKIIDFLAQIENFQKQLWLKKKFVLDTQYCVTLDKIPETLYPAIAKNDKQRKEWVELYAIDKLRGYGKPLKSGFLKANRGLVLDTRHFQQDFVDRLLSALSEVGPLEEQMNGLLVHGENSQALNLMRARYQEQVKCVYIDPPYNTAGDNFLYKDNYRHSSWISMIKNRKDLGMDFLVSNGVIFTNIDDREFANLFHLHSTDSEVMVWRKSGDGRDGKMKNTTTFRIDHEYIVVDYKNEKRLCKSIEKPNWKTKYPNLDSDPRGAYKAGSISNTEISIRP